MPVYKREEVLACKGDGKKVFCPECCRIESIKNVITTKEAEDDDLIIICDDCGKVIRK